MLNELCQLADALEKSGISPKEWHHQLKPLPNVSKTKPCYCISIAEDGAVDSLETINKDTSAVLRKWEPSLGDSFPGFNIQPLYRITDDEQKKRLKAWRDGKEPVDVQLLRSWCTPANQNWDNKIKKKIYKCLHEIPERLLKIVGGKNLCNSNAMSLLLGRSIRYSHATDENKSPANFYEQGFQHMLENFLWTAIEHRGPIKTLLPLIVHEGNSNKLPETDRGTVSVFLDVPDWKEYRVSSRETTDWLNGCLVGISEPEVGLDSLDAFGYSIHGSDGKLPSVKLPILADVKLRAMNSESSCQYRYRNIDAYSFPVGKESRRRAKGAIEWLSDESREGDTWGRSDSQELFFAYPVSLPKVSLKLTSCFGVRKSDDGEARFANAAREVIQVLNGTTGDLKSIELQVFSLRKMDTARTKLVFHRNYTAQRLVDATQEWENGCSNIPHIQIYAWGLEKGKSDVASPEFPFPLEIARCLNSIWKYDNKKKQLYCDPVPMFAPSCGIELLLEEPLRINITHLLSSFLSHARQLILFLSDAGSRKKVLVLSPKNYDRQKLLLPSIMGLLLYKLDIKKEEYMTKAPFLVGRMLKLADEIHTLYCKEVRENKLPPQLIGNALMTAALDSPVQALAQLALRLKPYYGWVQTFRGSENGKPSGYYVDLYGDVASQLSKVELPVRFNDAERAQLLLGYLSA